MAFRQSNILAHSVRFNSANSCDFLDAYHEIAASEIRKQAEKPSTKAIAPSSMYCPRVNWFRLRGVDPDAIDNPDERLDFTAQVGSAIHEVVQSRLSSTASADLVWLDVADHISMLSAKYPERNYACETSGFETKVSLTTPPVRFACDGLITFKGKLYLLEIKSCEYSSFQDLTEPKPSHYAQVRAYSALMEIADVLVLYIDRQYGDTKCFELHFNEAAQSEVINEMYELVRLADACLAPSKLESGNGWCTPGMCRYYKKCKEW